MKKSIIAVILLILFMTGCSNKEVATLEGKLDSKENQIQELNTRITELEKSNKDYKTEISKLNTDYKNLESEKNTLSNDNQVLAEQNESLTKELDEIKNGSDYLINEIRKLYNDKEYDQLLEKANNLHDKFPKSNADVEAQSYVAEINKMKEAEEQAKKEEEEKKAAEAKKSELDKLREIVRVKKVWISKPNSAGGVDLYVDWINKSEKTIKYITFECQIYNAVDDILYCDIRGYSTFRGTSTGPYKTGEGHGSSLYWENAWYANTASYVKLNGISIEYTDGTTTSIDGNDKVNLVIY